MTGEGLDDFDEAAEAEWQRLRAQIELAEGFWLGFVFTDAPRRAATLRERVGGLLRSRGADLWWASPVGVDELREATETILKVAEGHPLPGCIWVEAVDGEEPWLDGWSWLAARLNEHRESLRRSVPYGLVIVAPTAAKGIFHEVAPDLWSVRDVVLDFGPSGGPSLTLSMIALTPSEDPQEGRVFELKRALAEFPADAPDLVHADLCLHLSEALLTTGRTREAIAAAMAARLDMRLLADSMPSRVPLVAAHRMLGSAEWLDGDPGAARAHLREMAAVLHRIRLSPRSAAESRDVAGVAVYGLVTLAAVEAELGDRDASREARMEAIEIAEAAELDADARLSLLWYALTPVPYARVIEPEVGGEELARALSIAERLFAAAPTPTRADNLVTSLWHCARYEGQIGDLASSRARLLRALRLIENDLDGMLSDIQRKILLANTHSGLFQVERVAGFDSAEEHRSIFLEIVEELLPHFHGLQREAWEAAAAEIRSIIVSPAVSRRAPESDARPRRRRRPPP